MIQRLLPERNKILYEEWKSYLYQEATMRRMGISKTNTLYKEKTAAAVSPLFALVGRCVAA